MDRRNDAFGLADGRVRILGRGTRRSEYRCLCRHRVYEIRYRATDSKGASCTGTVHTTVPKSQGQPWQVIDSSVRYDSTAVIPKGS